MYRKAVFETSAEFLTNIAAGWFALLLIYTTVVELILKIMLVIISYIAAVELQKKSYEL